MFSTTGAVTYSVDVKPHEDGYLVTFPAIPQCQIYGNTYQGAVENARRLLEDYVDAYIAEGGPLVEDHLNVPSTLSVTIRLPVITSMEASKKYRLTHDYVARLCHRTHVLGFKVGRLWFLHEESLKSHITNAQIEHERRRKLLSDQIRRDLTE
jgi:predicted RNase H-like HicB family nuclease